MSTQRTRHPGSQPESDRSEPSTRRAPRGGAVAIDTSLARSPVRRLLLGSLLSVCAALLLHAATALAQVAPAAPFAASVGSGVRGTASVSAVGAGTVLTLTLDGLTPGATYQAVLNAGTCAQPGASVTTIATFNGNTAGHATAVGEARFRGTEPIAPAALLDGDHVVRLIVADQRAQEVACAQLPQVRSVSDVPTRLPATGTASSGAITASGIVVLAAVLLVGVGTTLRQRRA